MIKKSTKFGKIIYFSAIGLLFVGFAVLLLEKSQITDLYSKPVQVTATERPVNDIDYSPPTKEQQQEADQTKQQLIEQSNSTSPLPETISITLSAAGQDVNGGPLIVRSLVMGTTTGSCTLTLTKEGVTKEYSNQVTNLGTYYGCEGFNIPVSDLAAGTWQLTLKANNGNLNGSTSQEVVIES